MEMFRVVLASREVVSGDVNPPRAETTRFPLAGIPVLILTGLLSWPVFPESCSWALTNYRAFGFLHSNPVLKGILLNSSRIFIPFLPAPLIFQHRMLAPCYMFPGSWDTTILETTWPSHSWALVDFSTKWVFLKQCLSCNLAISTSKNLCEGHCCAVHCFTYRCSSWLFTRRWQKEAV